MAAGNVEKISVVLMLKNLMTHPIQTAQKQLKVVRANITGIGTVMGKTLPQFKKMRGNFRGIGAGGRRFGFQIRKATHGMRGFKMEMLGLMFFGMSLIRVFKGLTGTAMEWFGVTDILSPALGLLFMPIAEFMSNVAIKFLDWVTNLTDTQKKWINVLIVIVGILGFVFAVIGTLALGIGSLLLVFGGWGAIIALMSVVGAVIVGIGLIVSGIYLIFKKKFEGIGLVIMGIGVILLLFIGWWALIPIIVGAAIFLIIKYWKNIKAFLGNTFAAIGRFFKKWFWDKPKEWLNSLWGFVKNIFSKIKDTFNNSFLGKAISFGASVLGSFQTGGTIPQTGPYMMHKGEEVIPTGQVGAEGGVSNITNNFYGFTKEDLGRELDDRDRKLVNQLERNR